jgi:hypothetical protein
MSHFIGFIYRFVIRICDKCVAKKFQKLYNYQIKRKFINLEFLCDIIFPKTLKAIYPSTKTKTFNNFTDYARSCQ